VLGLGPTLYFYTQALLFPKFVFKAKHAIHYVAITIDLAAYQTAFGFNPVIFPGVTLASFTSHLGDIAVVASVFAYLFLSLRLIRHHKRNVSNTHEPSFRLLNGLIAGIGAITMLWENVHRNAASARLSTIKVSSREYPSGFVPVCQ
jgi:hypothetical protein